MEENLKKKKPKKKKKLVVDIMKCIRVDRDFYIVDLRSKNDIV